MTVVAYIALGSNLNNPRAQVQAALKRIAALLSTSVVAQSALHETKPLGPQDQPDYINQVIAVETSLSADELLASLQRIEHEMGRVRGIRWGARVIDCDILLYGDQVIQTASLIVPHPEMKNRSFVLHPLAEIAPDLVLPSGESVQNLIGCLV